MPKKKPKRQLVKRRSFSCTDADWAAVMELARRHDSSVSRILRQAIKALTVPAK